MVVMQELFVEDTKVNISVIENFVCDSAKDSTALAKMEQLVSRTLDEFVDVVKRTAVRPSGTRFIMVELTQRLRVPWYKESFKRFSAENTKRLTELQLINVSLVKYNELPPQIFDTQGVHWCLVWHSNF